MYYTQIARFEFCVGVWGQISGDSVKCIDIQKSALPVMTCIRMLIPYAFSQSPDSILYLVQPLVESMVPLKSSPMGSSILEIFSRNMYASHDTYTSTLVRDTGIMESETWMYLQTRNVSIAGISWMRGVSGCGSEGRPCETPPSLTNPSDCHDIQHLLNMAWCPVKTT